MALIVRNLATAVFLAILTSDLIKCFRISTDLERARKSFSQRENLNLVESSDRRRKRDVSEGSNSISESVKCIKISGVFEERTKEPKFVNSFKNEMHLNKDSKSNLQLAWTGNDYERIVVVTGEFGDSSVYLSDDSGRSFNNISHKLEKADEHEELTLLKHTNDSKTVYLVGNSMMATSTVLYVSKDGASTFQRISLDFKLESAFIFHSTRPDYVLAIDENYSKSLHLSRDRGLTWQKIKSNVMTGKWGSDMWIDEIFVISNNYTNFFETDSTANVLEKSKDFGDTWTPLHDKAYTFGLGDKFLYASIYKDLSQFSERYLKVSTDAGLTWNEVQLPTITQDRFFSILDSNEGKLFLHVDHPGDTGRGTLYTSDATGIIFSESLQNHLYPNYEDLTDFYRVQSMRGVYIASQLMSDDSIHTMITFDRGGEWQPIKRPEGVPCKDETKECYLQIHNLYSIKRGIRSDPPLSVPNAVGIILVHGHVADALQTTDPDVFVSSDGGYSWRLALKGPHHYQIADHGGLLVAVPADTDTPSVVKFSTDEGRCWISYNYTDAKIIYTGLLIEPGNRDMTVAIWGYTQEDKIWHTHILDFSQIIDRQCELSDYETWVPHQHNDDNGCLLGQKETFRRIKADSWCYNGKTYEIDKTSETCVCTADDFDCDYGYKRENDVCIKDSSVTLKELDICLRGHEEKFVPMGYHKIPGDKCSGGFLPTEAKLVDLSQICSFDSPAAAAAPSSGDPYNRHAALVLTAVLGIFSVVLIIVLVTYLAKKYEFIKASPTYRYTSIRCEDDDPTAIVVSHHKGTSLFEDSSDEEVPEPLKVVPNGKRTNDHAISPGVHGLNGHVVGNGHIPAGSKLSASTPNTQQAPTKSTFFESDDELLE